MLTLVPRHARTAVEAALADTRVVAVVGARQAGKSTLVREVLRGRSDGRERRLDRPNELAAARQDPERFVIHQGLLAVDEVQRAPELMLAIKAVVDEVARPGQFLLTGSARLLGLRGLSDALVGRSETVELWPFSQGEIGGHREQFVDVVFEVDPEGSPEAVEVLPDPSEVGYRGRVLRGGFPEAVARAAPPRRGRFFDGYVNDLIDRDVTQLADITRRDDLHRLLRLLAGRVSQPLSIDALSSELGLVGTTVERYVALFEEVFLVKRVAAWTSGATGRATRQRKLLAVDTGLAAHLSGVTERRLERQPAVFGPLLENFVLGEIARQLTWSSIGTRLFHYRTRDGVEVDGVLEAPDGTVVALEVKGAQTVRWEDFRHLRHIAAKIPDRFRLGVVLHTGSDCLSFGSRLWAVPIDRLWRWTLDAPP